MAIENAVCLGGARRIDEQVRKSCRSTRERRKSCAPRACMPRRSRLVSTLSHVPNELERAIRNDIYRGRSPSATQDALEWALAAPELRPKF